jgi:DNA-binding NarL/FixJ family response regulator
VRAARTCEHRRVAATVLIVDDFAPFRAAARALLEADGFLVVGEAQDGPSAAAAVARLRPDVVLLDIQLPGEDGFVVAGRLAGQARIVLTSSRDARESGWRPAADGPPFIAKADLSGPALAAVLAAA